ncbi:hypothetical protein ACFSFW_07440 [Fredinandcohnia salidurans]|uniref:Uncharacterized protein n=1 Tax=Fredinandcohnia salidurans TaxID=2595041 RepID=A0ABW4ML22_9BACI
MFGIKNYEPIFYSNYNEFIKEHGEGLRRLKGSPLEAIITVHNANDGEFWSDCPVILVIGGIQLEFCTFKDCVSVTWDEIDMNERLDWYGSQNLQLEWQKNIVENVTSMIGKKIEEVEIIEASPGILHGIGFQIGANYVSIFNALDETGFAYVKDEGFAYTKL